MRAVVLAAGVGSRMGGAAGGAPACALPFGDATLLDATVSALSECGVPAGSVTVVLGYGADRVRVPDGAGVVLNRDYGGSDNSLSLRLALEAAGGRDEDVLVLDSNVAFSPAALGDLISCGGSAVLVAEGRSESCTTGVLVDQSGRVLALGKHLPSDESHFGGAALLSAPCRRALLGELGTGRFDRDWYTVPLNGLLRDHEVRAAVTRHPVAKVGTEAEYRRAKRVFGVEKLSVLLVGASGFLGAKMRSVLSRRYDVVGTSRSGGGGLVALDPLDARRLSAVFEMCRPDVVVNLVGLADPDACDADQALAYDLNVRVVENLAASCRESGASLVQMSTDYVFDGGSGEPLAPGAERRPRSYYGMTKKLAEDVASSLPGSLVVRVPVLYGFNGPGDKPTFPSRVLGALRSGERVACDDAQVRYPVLIDDACEAVASHLTDAGVVHVSSTEPVTKYGWARAVAREFGLDEGLVVRSDAPTAANRPAHVRLALDGTGFEARGVAEGTRAMARQMSCSFDLVYRRAPAERVGGAGVAEFRLGLGRALGRRLAGSFPPDVDFVAPVPNSGLYYAMGLSEALGVPYLQALVKRDADRRSYQLQSLSEREAVLRGNVLPIRGLVEGRRVALVDEAVFTGVTMRTVCDALRACGALSVDVFVPTPVCGRRCPYGVHPDRAMLAESVPAADMADHFRVRSVTFGAWEDFGACVRGSGPGVCAECFGGLG